MTYTSFLSLVFQNHVDSRPKQINTTIINNINLNIPGQVLPTNNNNQSKNGNNIDMLHNSIEQD